MRQHLACLLPLAGLSGLPALADTVDLVPIADNTLYFDPSGSLSNGAGPVMFAGRTGGGETRRAVLRFDVTSSIPAGSTVTSVSLELTITMSASSVPDDQSIHMLTSDWGESTSVASSGGGGGGGTAQPGDATWIHTFSPSSNWTTAGGDFVATASATASVPASGTVSFNGPGLAADVQAWLDGTQSDYGWLIKGPEVGGSTARRYATHENSSLTPLLTIEFDPPSTIGSIICTTTPNSSGNLATLTATGSSSAAANDLTLNASGLPPQQFGIFVTSQTVSANPSGNLCLGGMIGRFTQPSQILQSGSTGEFALTLDLDSFPQGSGFVAVSAGETWNFQAWHRDIVAPGSGFSDGLAVTFQ